jgi:hypothetical protein
MSPRSRKLKVALERLGHTNVTVRWEPIGPALEMCGHSGGYFFESDQATGVNPLGISLDEAMHWVKVYKAKR